MLRIVLSSLDLIGKFLYLFEFWIQTNWFIAFLMSLTINLSVYLVTAYAIDFICKIISRDNKIAQYIDNRPFKKGQKSVEIKNGFIACIMFAFVSLFARELFVGVIPLSITDLLIEVLAFILFYETYSYWVHRLLHTRPFRKAHSVHHYSVRTSVWSAYSVHPLEAVLIGMSAPIFMLMFPVHLIVIFAFHIFGVVFTLILHSNIKFNSNNFLCQLINRYTQSHAAHHVIGNVNFGFVNAFWDRCFKTNH